MWVHTLKWEIWLDVTGLWPKKTGLSQINKVFNVKVKEKYLLQSTEENVQFLTPPLSEHVFGTLDFSRRDLPALNIQRARDHGVSDYNTVRESFDLPRIADWNEINSDPDIQSGVSHEKKRLCATMFTNEHVLIFGKWHTKRSKWHTNNVEIFARDFWVFSQLCLYR